MPEVKQVFQRREMKYLLTQDKKRALLERLSPHVHADSYGTSRICSLYLDTWDYSLIRQSLEKPLYKEKLRLRSYGVPGDETAVFLELKKKYKGVVYKRREKLTLSEARQYLAGGPMPKDTQIMREIDWAIRSRGGVKPAALISYDREAYLSKADPGLRITFDSNLTFRTKNLLLEEGASGQRLLNSQWTIMEIKTIQAMPLWLVKLLDDLDIYPSSFSKYGTVYEYYIGGASCSRAFFNPYLQTPLLSQAT